jgi:glycosyltransferase involved in cell wall biosynthesis
MAIRDNPEVSVVMSVYNNEAFLRDSIESILKQSFDDFEFIIVNDGSTDSSVTILRKYAGADRRIRLLQQQNHGLAKALNKAISLSRGIYIARQDADDLSMPDRLQRQVSYLRSGFDFCCARTVVRQTRSVHPRFFSAYLYRALMPFKNVFIHGTFCFKKNVFDELKGYDESIDYAQDYDLVCRLMLGGYSIKFLPDILYISNKTKDCISKASLPQQRKSFADIRQRHFSKSGRPRMR